MPGPNNFTHSGSQHVQHVLHTQPEVADAQTPATLLCVKGDAL